MKVSLPSEVKIHIFEHAAYMHPRYAHTFSVVSKRIQFCVEKIMYKSLMVVTNADNLPTRYPETAEFERILPTFQKRPAEFFATRVQDLMFYSEMPPHFAQIILDKCTGARNISYWPFYKQRHGPLSLSCAHTLQTLFTSAAAFQGLADSKTVFPKVTYVSLEKFYPGYVLPSLEWLPALEDLYLCEHNDWEAVIKTVSLTAPCLRRLSLDVEEWHVIAMKQWAERNPSPVELQVREVGYVYGNGLDQWREMFNYYVPD